VTVTGVRYTGDGDGLGYSVAASGRYVIACCSAPATYEFYLWRRNDAGVLQLLLEKYDAVTPSVAPYARSCSCWYNEAEERLEIVIGTADDSNPTRKSGSVLFMDWPDDGSVAGDMVEFGLVSAHPDDQFDPQGIGRGVAMCNGRCIALGTAATHNVLFLSRTGDVWSRDKLDTTTYDWYWNFDAPPVGLVEHPTIAGKVVGVIPCAYYGTNGAHFVVTSTGPGDTWADVARLDGNEGGGDWDTGRGGTIGPGANGNLTIAADWLQNPEGFAIWDRDPTDDTDATWIYRGRVKVTNRENPIAIAVGYNFIAGGDAYNYLGNSRVGPINATVFDGPAPGAWNVDQYAEFYFAGPDYHALEDGMLHPNGMALGYQEGGIVRLITGCYAYKPGPPPGTGDTKAGIIEHNGDGDWPSPPVPAGARAPAPAAYLDLTATEAPLARIVLINVYPENLDVGVKADANLNLTIASLDNVALATTTKVYISIGEAQAELVYDQGGTGFQTGWDGANSLATVQKSPGSGVNDELKLVIDRTTDYPSEAQITVFVEAATA
jgi:hypothetical protein